MPICSRQTNRNKNRNSKQSIVCSFDRSIFLIFLIIDISIGIFLVLMYLVRYQNMKYFKIDTMSVKRFRTCSRILKFSNRTSICQSFHMIYMPFTFFFFFCYKSFTPHMRINLVHVAQLIRTENIFIFK